MVRALQQTMIVCPVCKRKFGLKAADRHIEFCKKQSLKKKENALLLGEFKNSTSDINNTLQSS
jgi:hypothetical protein